MLNSRDLKLTYNPAPGGLEASDTHGTSAYSTSAYSLSRGDLNLSSPRHHTRPFLSQLCLLRSALIFQTRIDLDGG